MTCFKDLTKEEKNELINILYIFNEYLKNEITFLEKEKILSDILKLRDDAFNGEIHLDEMKKMTIYLYTQYFDITGYKKNDIGEELIDLTLDDYWLENLI